MAELAAVLGPVVTEPADAERMARIGDAIGDLVRLTHSARVHDRRVRATGIEISRTDIRLLSRVDADGPVSVSKIAAALDVSQPTASRSLLHLEQEGYVARTPDPADGRVVRYAVTGKGRRALAKLRGHMDAQMAAALAAMAPDDRGALAELLEEFVTRLRGEPAHRARR